MLPKIALLGRPNVGKSTLFNRLIRSNRAITHDRPGVTRDRMEGVVRSRSGRSFTLIDTGGVTLDSHHSVADGPEGLRGFEAEILQQVAGNVGGARLGHGAVSAGLDFQYRKAAGRWLRGYD